jgi:hypothetical protein
MRLVPLLGVPLLLVVLGALAIGERPPHHEEADALLVASALVGVALGVARGGSERVWPAADGAPMRQGTRTTALLWLLSIAVRVATIPLLRDAGAPAAAGQVELVLGISLAAQHTVLIARSGGLAVIAPQRRRART